MRKILIILFLCLMPLVCGAETWELAVQPYDKADLPSGHKRAKQGDIVAVKPYPWAWGKAELENYLIVIVNNLTEEEAMAMMQPYYKDDAEPTLENKPEVTAKRKFKVDVSSLKSEIEPLLEIPSGPSKITSQPLKSKGTQISIDTLESYDIFQNKHDLKWRKAKKTK